MDYLSGMTGADFDDAEYLAQYPDELLGSSRGRRYITKCDPLAFALIYFRHHLRSGANHDGPVTLSDFHLDMCRSTLKWISQEAQRLVEVAPRDSGKSTWNFLIRPMWALAHGWRKYAAAFADSGPQAEQHLMSFKGELDNNPLLRKDFPTLCRAKVRVSGVTVSDTKSLYVSSDNKVFQAKGIDSSTLGSKVGNQRPDLILFDDIEPDASNYSDYQKDKRAHSMINSVLPMNLDAAVIVSGTVTMPGSVVHDLVRTVTQPSGDWVDDLKGRPDITQEGFKVNYYPALFEGEDGEPRSVWPQRWPVEFLESIKHTNSFMLNFMNDPMGKEGNWWTKDDFKYECLGDRATRWMLQIDPAVTSKGTSDYTGLAVLACAMPRRDEQGNIIEPKRVEVKYARGVKLVGEPLRKLVLKILNEFPRIKVIRVEANQGGETWHTLLHDMPVPVQIFNSVHKKEIRLERGLDWYQRLGRRVVHHEPLTAMELQAVSYPNTKNDDIIDAVCLGILYFFDKPEPVVVVGAKSYSYLGR